MKVLQLGPYPPPHGGIQTHIVALVEFLRESGVDCEVINLTRFRRPSQNAIFYPPNSFSVLCHLLSHHYDVIHLHVGGRIWFRQLGLALMCCSLPKSKCVFTFHSGGYPSSPEGRSARRRTLRAFVLRRFDRVIAVNTEIARFFEQLGIPEGLIRLVSPYVPLPSDVLKQDAVPAPVADFLTHHHPVLISVGLLEPEYDVGLQMTALGSILKVRPQAGLLIVGSGSLEEMLRKQRSHVPYGEHILFSGDLEHTATLQSIQRSDLMVRTTWYDGDALSVREALNLGTPVIATDNGMRPEGVRLIPARDLDALVAGIKEMLAGSHGPKSVVPATGNRNLKEILGLYEELVCQRRSLT